MPSSSRSSPKSDARGLTNAEILLRVFATSGVDDRTRAVLVAVERRLLPGSGAASDPPG